MNEELTNLLEGIETANNIKQYEEGLGDVVHKIGTGIKNVFGTKAGAAQRAVADAQTNAQTAQNNGNAQALNNQVAQLSAPDAAQKIIDLLKQAFKNDQKLQDKATKQAAKDQKKADVAAQTAKNAQAAADKANTTANKSNAAAKGDSNGQA